MNAVGMGGGTTATATKTEGPSGKKTNIKTKKNQNGFVDWRALDFRAGDVCVLDPRVVHMSSANRSRGDSHRARVSCDTRWQSEGDPADPRVGAWRPRAAPRPAVVALHRRADASPRPPRTPPRDPPAPRPTPRTPPPAGASAP